MEMLSRTLGPGVHCYSPFPDASGPRRDADLSELCKNSILERVTLRRLSRAAAELPLPKRLLRYLGHLTTADFEKIECAPFGDLFGLPFLHRALTYRATCWRDGREYVIAYGHGPGEEPKAEEEHRKWVDLRHRNVMCVCATVRDPATDNVFYVYDRPALSLRRMWDAICDRNRSVPDAFYWRLAADLCRGLRGTVGGGLRYGRFCPDNVFVVEDRLVLENGLTRKGVKYAEGDCGSEGLRDVLSILRHLVPNSRRSPSLLRLVREIENENSIDAVLDLVEGAERETSSFSFLRLVRSLKD